MDKNQPLLIDIGNGLSLMVGLPRIATWKSTERPERARRGTFGFNTQTSSLEYFDGKDWLSAELKQA